MNHQLSRTNGHVHTTGPEEVLKASVCWTALMEDAGTPVLVLDAAGRIVQANLQGASLLGTTAASGRSYTDFYPADFARERLEFVRAVAETGQPVMVEGMVNGGWHRTSMRRMAPGHDGSVLVLMVLTPASKGEQRPGTPPIRAKFDDFGPLSVLTNRELEILRLIGNALSTAEIAKELHRSVKTIEWHRVSLGNKLKAANRVGLARIAIQAGLSGLRKEASPPAPVAAMPTPNAAAA
jgi:DNA-binding CsgD family transcriptional regulator